MEETNTKLAELCCTGLTLSEVLEQIDEKWTKFYAQRYVVELSVVDSEEYELLLSRNEIPTFLNLTELCKQRLLEPQRREKMASLRQIGLLLC